MRRQFRRGDECGDLGAEGALQQALFLSSGNRVAIDLGHEGPRIGFLRVLLTKHRSGMSTSGHAPGANGTTEARFVINWVASAASPSVRRRGSDLAKTDQVAAGGGWSLSLSSTGRASNSRPS